MKTSEINPFNMYAAPVKTHAFDPLKFARLIREKSRKSWWQHFIDSVERKHGEIMRELLQYRLAQKKTN